MYKKLLLGILIVLLIIILIIHQSNKETFITSAQLNTYNLRCIAKFHFKEIAKLKKVSNQRDVIRYVGITKDNQIINLTKNDFDKIKNAALNTEDNSFFNNAYAI